MKRDDRRPRLRRPGWAVALLLVGAPAAQAGIYTCVDAAGRRLTSDRYIQACSDREQKELNKDGSVRRILPPTYTADEVAAIAAKKAAEDALLAAQLDAAKHDKNLLARFRNEAEHQQRRDQALDDVRSAIQSSERRLAALAAERKPLMDEAEFYVGKVLPLKLKQQIEANDASTEAQRVLIQNQQAEMVRIHALFDAELAHLRRLWAGAAPGTIGRAPDAAASAAVRTTPAEKAARKTAAR